jgi:hypothetical protein
MMPIIWTKFLTYLRNEQPDTYTEVSRYLQGVIEGNENETIQFFNLLNHISGAFCIPEMTIEECIEKWWVGFKKQATIVEILPNDYLH